MKLSKKRENQKSPCLFGQNIPVKRVRQELFSKLFGKEKVVSLMVLAEGFLEFYDPELDSITEIIDA